MQRTLELRGYWQMSGTGVSGLVQLAAHCEVEQGMLVLQIGRSSENANDCSAEIAGEFLLYTLSLGAGEIYLSATPMDSVAPPQMLLRCVDNTTGWGTVSKLMRAMEEHRIRSLERPIVIDGFAADGSDSWTIV